MLPGRKASGGGGARQHEWIEDVVVADVPVFGRRQDRARNAVVEIVVIQRRVAEISGRDIVVEPVGVAEDVLNHGSREGRQQGNLLIANLDQVLPKQVRFVLAMTRRGAFGRDRNGVLRRRHFWLRDIHHRIERDHGFVIEHVPVEISGPGEQHDRHPAMLRVAGVDGCGRGRVEHEMSGVFHEAVRVADIRARLVHDDIRALLAVGAVVDDFHNANGARGVKELEGEGDRNRSRPEFSPNRRDDFGVRMRHVHRERVGRHDHWGAVAGHPVALAGDGNPIGGRGIGRDALRGVVDWQALG